MATRTPIEPKNKIARSDKGWRENPSVQGNNGGTRRRSKFVVPPKRTRLQKVRSRIWRFLTHPAFFLPVILLTVSAVLTLGYFWSEFSQRIDVLLSGEIYTRSAGIYAAPKTLHDGDAVSANDLAAYLKTADYVEKNSNASPNRGRFTINGNSEILIEPGSDTKIDGLQAFQPLRVRFDKAGKNVQKIESPTTGQDYKSAMLEPKLLSSVLSEDHGRRKTVEFKDLPPILVKAITTTEDRAFFEHYGVNVRGVLRALWRRVDTEDNSPIARQGGSSITQQLVKNLLLSPEKSLTRKLQEAYMSIILETRLSKEQIFTLYANQIYLGQQAGFSLNGVGEAANAYFGKDVSQLTLPEAAFIAGIIRSPNRYNPYKNADKTTERRNQVIDSMLEAKVITADEAQKAKATPLVLQQPQKRADLLDTPYFTEYAQSDLGKIVNDPEALQHLRVYTTLDPDLQQTAHDALANRLNKLDKVFKNKAGLNAALVAIRPKTGEIVAMVGGRDYLQNQFNRATEAQRQPGSVFKPFVYATAINTAYDPTPRVITAATIFKDEAKVFTSGRDVYKPNNYGDFFSNKELTVRDALVKSKNVITVDVAMELNVGKVMNLAAKAGLPKVAKAYPSMALGTAEVTPLQMASAYTTFANLGQRTTPLSIARVTTGDGTTVAAPTAQKSDVLRSDVAYIMDDMMKDVVNRGTAADLRAWGFKNVPNKIGIAGKTGTSRDGWFAGFTPELVCVVYVGFDDGDDLGMKGSESAMPIWADFMKSALAAHPEWNADWAMPSGVEKAEIDTRTGQVIETNNAVSVDGSPTPTATTQVTIDENGNQVLTDTAPNQTNSSVAAVVVPPEFRRAELFISGTIPRKADNAENAASSQPEEFPIPDESPAPAPTRNNETTPSPVYIEPNSPMRSQNNQPNTGGGDSPNVPQRTIVLQICPETGLIAVPSCPHPRPQTFRLGEEPKQFCSPQNHQPKQ